MSVSLDTLAGDELQLDLLADRLADRLAIRLSLATGRPEALIDASEVARITGKTRSWVYDHAGDLGAVRLGSGLRPRLGFFPARVLEHFEKVADPPPLPIPAYTKPRLRRRPSHITSGAKLLEVRPPVRVKEPERGQPQPPSARRVPHRHGHTTRHPASGPPCLDCD